jgi:hypothetical protein
MKPPNMCRAVRLGLLVPGLLLLAGCSRAPSVDLVGSFFPAWLVCLAAAVALAARLRLALLRARLKLAYPIVVYPSLTAIFTFVLWFLFFY